MASAILILLIFLALLAGLVALIYNRLVKASNEYKRSLAQIDVQLKRRYDLIPNLVESAKGYLSHEKSTLEEVIKARNQAAQFRQTCSDDPSNAKALESLVTADTALTGVLGRLMMISEQYPQLKADSTIKNLMDELNNTENQISGARSTYNYAVMEYNKTIELFPNVFFSGLFGFSKASSWVLTDQAEAAPVRFSFGTKP
ncbi:MAG: LemA family protein [Deltaproteobacteria bacterium]|jgi:LemA protein|nr:LemA family protein [Deltaproteobacteria bacterium]